MNSTMEEEPGRTIIAWATKDKASVVHPECVKAHNDDKKTEFLTVAITDKRSEYLGQCQHCTQCGKEIIPNN